MEDKEKRAESKEEEAAARLSGLEKAVAGKDEEIAGLKQSKTELEARYAGAVASYRALALRGNPELVAELVSGDTVEAIDESLTKARTLVDKVKQELAAGISSGKVPAGAPPRTAPDLSALSPREKIQYAIGGKR